MEIIIGTYEEFLVGFQLKKRSSIQEEQDNVSNEYLLEQSFTNHGHNGSVRCLAASNKYIASGSIDERINLINIRHRLETGTLISHSGTITALEFLRTSYLFSASDDGTIAIWSAGKVWNLEKILRGHKDSVTAINIHPSGKLLLSISKDLTLRTWNLIKGRCAYIVNLKDVGHQVLWSSSCLYFAIIFDTHIDVYDISNGSIKYHISQRDIGLIGKRLNKIVYIDDNRLIITGDSPDLIVFDLETKKIINRIQRAHENRIKDLTLIDWNRIEPDEKLSELINETKRQSHQRWLLTCSSDGFIKIWLFNFNDLTENPILIAKVDSTCRPTCLVVWTSVITSNVEHDFILPELKITKEELESCRAKAAKKSEKIDPEILKSDDGKKQTNIVTSDSLIHNNNHDNNSDEKELSSKFDHEEEEKVHHKNDNDDDDDDEIAIREMKQKSKTIKMMMKDSIKKSKNKKMTTFKMYFIQLRRMRKKYIYSCLI
nr:p21-activated protein kinase-interacting protein 1-like [Dermatophagoides farinae]